MIKETDVSESVLNIYTTPNPQYYTMMRMGKPAPYISKNKKIYFGGQLPPGAAYWSHREGNTLDKGDSMKKGSLKYPKAVLKMRDYQEEPIARACGVRCALIEAPTGSGKTAMASRIIQDSGQKTLMLCNSIDLMHQSAQEIEDFLGVKPSVFFGKEKEFGNITVSTYMSAVKNKKLFAEFGFELLIVDEADIFTTDRYMEFLCTFPYKRVFGFTATLNIEKYDANMPREIRLIERLWGLVITVETDLQIDILDEILTTEYEKTYSSYNTLNHRS